MFHLVLYSLGLLNWHNFCIESLGISHHALQFCFPPSPSIFSTPCRGSPNEQNKNNNKQQQPLFALPSLFPLQHLFIHSGGIGSLSASHGTSFCPISFTGRCSLQRVSGKSSSLDPHQNSSLISPGSSEVWGSCGQHSGPRWGGPTAGLAMGQGDSWAGQSRPLGLLP